MEVQHFVLLINLIVVIAFLILYSFITKSRRKRNYDELQAKYDKLETEFNELKRDYEALKEAYSEIRMENKLLKSENEELRDRVDHLRGWLIGLVLAFIASIVPLVIALSG